jgi:hypothetical protein
LVCSNLRGDSGIDGRIILKFISDKENKYCGRKVCRKKEDTADFSTICPYRVETMLGKQ